MFRSPVSELSQSLEKSWEKSSVPFKNPAASALAEIATALACYFAGSTRPADDKGFVSMRRIGGVVSGSDWKRPSIRQTPFFEYPSHKLSPSTTSHCRSDRVKKILRTSPLKQYEIFSHAQNAFFKR